jgi:hypothetical protein
VADLKSDHQTLTEKFTKTNMPVSVIPYLNKDMLNALGVTDITAVTKIVEASKKVLK